MEKGRWRIQYGSRRTFIEGGGRLPGRRGSGKTNLEASPTNFCPCIRNVLEFLVTLNSSIFPVVKNPSSREPSLTKTDAALEVWNQAPKRAIFIFVFTVL